MTRFNSGLVGTEREVSSVIAPGVWTVNEQNLLKRNSLWPIPDEATDPYIGYVVLLLKMNGANGSTVFTDSSLYSNTVTANGNAQISTTQSKFDSASGIFDGNNDYLQVNSSGIFDFPGDFTIECWVRTVGNSANQGLIIRRVLDTYGTGTWGIQINNGTISFSSLQLGGIGTNFGTVPLNTWTHIAVSRSNSIIRMFIDGVLNATVTDSTNFSNSQNVFIGAWDRLGSGSVPTRGWLNGYIDELRITKGIARYTSTFQPRTTPFPTTTSNTGDLYYPSVSLLLHMDGSNGSTAFTDSSFNALTMTANGNAQISTAQSKFGGASAVFDGTTDYLTLASSSLFALFAGDFTVEFWVRVSNTSNNQTLVQLSASGTERANVSIVSGLVVLYSETGGTGAIRISGTAPATNTWAHVAWVRDGSTSRLFLNGASLGTAVSAPYPSGNMLVSIGANDRQSGGTCVNGYIDEVRITKGISRYNTTSFTVPTTAFPNSL